MAPSSERASEGGGGGTKRETDEDTVKGKSNENKQADSRGFTLSFPDGLPWISSLVLVQLSVQRGVSYTWLQRYSITAGGKKKKKSRGQAVLMLIGIITGVFKLSGGGSVTLCKLKQAHSKAPVNGG